MIRARLRDDRGLVAVLSAVLAPVVFGLCAFTVDCGNWYVTAQSVQRAADAAALAGVPYLPGNRNGALAQAITTAADNGFTTGGSTVVDPEPVPGQPNQLRVTITTVVDNTFGKILGDNSTTIRRSAVATFQHPLPMGSPCNEFGNGPEPTTGATNQRSSLCSGAGQFWANVGSPKAGKSYGDAYQDNNCYSSAGGTDNCSGGTNSDYSSEGYFYAVNVSQPVTNLTLQAFDPAFVSVGDLCTQNFGSGYTAASYAKNQYNYNASTSASTATYKQDKNLYGSGQSNPYCTGDQLFSETGRPPDTTFTIRQPSASSSLYDPTTFPVVGGCTKTFKGFSGDLYTALNQYQQSSGVVQYTNGQPVTASGYQPQVASEFRQWVTLCTIPGTISPGTYFIQVQTNGPADDPSGDGHNRFAMRAFGSSSSDNSAISITGLTDMAIYANLPSAHTSFYLTRVEPAAAGQILDVRLFDIGDSSQPGTVRIVPPTDSGLSSFAGCVGAGPTSGSLTSCSVPANSSYNGKWETISVPIPSGYTCNSSVPTGCWITLSYDYGAGQPSDTTSWQASLEGSPVRLIQ